MGEPTVPPVAGSLLSVLWSSRLVVLLFSMLIYSFGFATLVPFLPTLSTNFFASRHAGHSINCEVFDVGQQPAACQDAHADVVQWTSWTSLVANTFISFVFSPLIGDLSDTYGRKPFIIGGLALSTLPVAVVFMYLTGHLSLLWYYPCNALTSVISTIVVYLSYTADVLPPQHRTAGFGLIIAAFSLGFVVGPLLGRVLEPTTAAIISAAGSLASIAVVALAVPESRPPTAAAVLHVDSGSAARPRRTRPLDALLSLRKSWALINSSSLFKRLALCMAIVGVVSEGIQDMLIQYLQLVLGFNTSDQSLLIVSLGAANLIVQAALLPFLVVTLGERRLLLMGLVFSVFEQALLAVTATKWQAYAAVTLGSVAGVAYPAISSIKSTHSRADQQGLVQGALAGIRALATGLGPLAFAQLFAMCTKTSAVFGYRPGIVFWTTGALTIAAAAVAASIPAHLVKKPGQLVNQVGNRSSSAGHGSNQCATAVPAGEYTAVNIITEDGHTSVKNDISVFSGRDVDAVGKISVAKVDNQHKIVQGGASEATGSQAAPGQGSVRGVDSSSVLCAAAVAAWQGDVQLGLESTPSFVVQQVVSDQDLQDGMADSRQDTYGDLGFRQPLLGLHTDSEPV